MPRYEADPSNVTAAIAILPKDEYELELGTPKAFERTAKAGHQSYGIRIAARVVSGPMAGKKTVLNFYLHSDGAQQMTKRFQMACAGFSFSAANEEKYDATVRGQDWSFDTDTGECGAQWAALAGVHVTVSADVKIVKNDKDEDVEQQDWGTWSPIQ